MDQFWGGVWYSVIFIALAIGVWGWIALLIKNGPRSLFGYERVTLNQFENAALYKNGTFERVLPSGVHWVRARNRRLTVVDIRPEVLRLDQTSITSDHFAAAMRYIARVQIKDPIAAISVSQNYKDEICARLQLVVKKLGESHSVKELCMDHARFNAQAQELASGAMADAGYECVGFEILQIEPVGTIAEMGSKSVGFTSH